MKPLKMIIALIMIIILFSTGLLFAQLNATDRSNIFWHIYDNGDSQGNVWWMGDPTMAENGSIGGYEDEEYLILDTPTVNLSNTNSTLTFKMRYLFQSPQTYGDDAFNIRISTNGGMTWFPISGSPNYNIASSYAFGNTWGEGANIPGYGGNSDGWVNASFDLSAYNGQNIKIRFVFASDDSQSSENNPTWFGVMIDDIAVGNYSNNGIADGQMSIPNPFTPHDMLANGNYMWIAAETGLYKMDITTYQCEVMTPFNSNIPFATGLEQDNQGNLWIASFGYGVFKYDGDNWTTYNMANSDLPGDNIYRIKIDNSGRIWAACYGAGLAVLENGVWTSYNTSNSDIPTNMIWCLEIDNSNKIWIGTGGHFGMGVGMAVLDLTNYSWTVYNHANSGLPSNDIMFIETDAQNRKWIGTEDDGIAILDNNEWTVYNTSNSALTSNKINSIAFDLDESVWLGMADEDNGGVAHFDGTDSWTIYNQDNSGMISNDCVYSICIDSQCRKWIGTWEGIVIFDGTTWIRPYISEIVASDSPVQVVPEFFLSNYPNPFNPTTTISYNLPNSGQTEISVYNIKGQLVKQLVNEFQESGEHTITWNGKDDSDNPVSSGIYFSKVSSVGKTQIHKMMMIK